MSYSINDTRWDKKISWAVAAYFLLHTALITFRISARVDSRLPSVVTGALIIIFLLYSIKGVIKRSSEILVISFVIGLAVYSISLLLAVKRGEPVGPILRWSAFPSFAWWIPIGVWALSVKRIDVLYRSLLRVSVIMSLLWFLTLFSSGASLIGDDPEHSYNMMLGMGLLLPCMLHLNEYNQSNKIWWLILGVTEAIIIIVYGNRGPLICLGVFLVYRFLIDGNNPFYKIVTILSILLLVLYKDLIVQYLAYLLDSLSINSRTLHLLIEGRIEDTSGRDDLWIKCFEMINEKPILGWGIGGETTELSIRMGQSVNHAFSAHNGLIQNWLHFGYIFGTAVSLLFVLPFFFPNKFKDDEHLQGLILVFMSYYASRFISASGFFVDPEISVFFYLFYFRKRALQNSQ